jgi:hypothetical protein
MLDPKEIRKQAQAELDAEELRAAVDKEKQRIQEQRTFWRRLFPWRVRFFKV